MSLPTSLKEGDGGWDSPSHCSIVGQCFCKTSHVPPEQDTPGAPHTWDLRSLPLACSDLTNSVSTKNPSVELEEESNSLQTLPVQCPDVPEQSIAHSWGPRAGPPHMWGGQMQLLHTLGQWGTPGQWGFPLWGPCEVTLSPQGFWTPTILQDSTIHRVPQQPWNDAPNAEPGRGRG